MSFLASYKDGRVLLNVHVQPKASRNSVKGVHDNGVKLAITAPPVDGKANAAVIDFLASLLGVKKRELEICRGLHSRKKGVLVEGLEEDEIRSRILSVIDG